MLYKKTIQSSGSTLVLKRFSYTWRLYSLVCHKCIVDVCLTSDYELAVNDIGESWNLLILTQNAFLG